MGTHSLVRRWGWPCFWQFWQPLGLLESSALLQPQFATVMRAVCQKPHAPLDRATVMSMTNVLVTSTVGSTTVKTIQQGRPTVARRNPVFWAIPLKQGLTGTAAGNQVS